MIPIHSLRTKILIIVFALITVMGGAFFIYTIITSINYKQLRLDGIEKTVEFETEKVNRIISEIEHGAVFFAFGGMLSYETQSEELIEKFSFDFLSSFPVSVSSGLWFEPYTHRSDQLRAGFYAFYDKETGNVKIDDSFSIEDYDYHAKSWYLDIANELKNPYQVVWTRPYVDDDDSFSLMTTAGSGVFDENGKLIVLSTVDWKIDEVIKELTAIKPTENSFVLLCVPKNDYVISSTRTRSTIGASIESIPWDITADSFELEGITYFRFGRYVDNGWLVSVQIPEKEIFAEMEKDNRNFTILIGFASVFMLCFAFYLISRYINAPLTQLTTEVSTLALGNLDNKLKFSSKDELGQLADVFNKMTKELKESIRENIHEHAENERINTELNVATKIQTSMLPCVFPPFPDRNEFDLYASMVSARHVGGDFYDFYLIDRDNLAVVIADVMGKGVPAALFMVVTKTLIENCSFSKSPKKVFEMVNRKLMKNNKEGMFVTAFMGFYNIPTGRFVYANAGHNPPLLKKNGKSFEYLKTESCIVLAWMEDAKYTEQEIILEKGDVLFLYTDGAPETMNPQMELFSEQRLVDVLNKNKDVTAKKLIKAVKNELNQFRCKEEQADDITMLALKITEEKEIQYLNKDEEIKKLSIDAKHENLHEVIDFVNKELEKTGCSPESINEIDIAVEEIFMNIVNYAYKPNTGKVHISVYITDKTIIRFEDTGRPYNPLEQESPDLDTNAASREIGGLGIFMVKNIMDYMEYSRLDDKNILIITKNPPIL